MHAKPITRFCLPLCVLFLLLIAGCSSSPGDVDGDDGTAPTRVLDLAVTAFTATSVTLGWTATGDDGQVGTATRYDLRYSTFALHWQNWDQATQVAGEPTPRAAGSAETMTVTGLLPDSTYFFAIQTYDEENNCEGLSNVVVQACFDDMVVVIPDANLEAALRETFNMPTGDLYRSTMRSLNDFTAESRNISDMTGLAECANLGHLNLAINQIGDLGPLADLAQLWHLNLWQNAVSDLSPLAGVTGLVQLHLGDNSITSIAALASLTGLENLLIANNDISDIGPLAGMTGLIELDLGGNAVADLLPLQGLTGLLYLRLSGNQIVDIGAVAGLTGLKELRLSSNPLGGIGAIAGLTNLETLELIDCGVTDIGPLADLSGMRHLILGYSSIGDFSALANLTLLQSLGVISAGMVDVGVLAGLTELEYLSLPNNQIVDIGPLVANAGLGAGDTVNLENNPLSAQSLGEHIPALQARGVTVAY